ncbi:5400_t:CDS:2, partial [Cetraspora pellucida]
NKKVLAICQIHTSLNFTQQKKQICISEATFNQTNAPSIIEQNETSADLGKEYEELDDNKPIKEEKEERSDSLNNIEGDLLSNYKHPTIDNKAKWELKNVFNMLFLIPNYM